MNLTYQVNVIHFLRSFSLFERRYEASEVMISVGNCQKNFTELFSENVLGNKVNKFKTRVCVLHKLQGFFVKENCGSTSHQPKFSNRATDQWLDK